MPTRWCAAPARATTRGRAAHLVTTPRATDPYLDPRTGILRNNVDASTQAELDRAEADLVGARALQLVDAPIAGAYDLAHLCAIHRHLFADVYPFAGELRTVNIYKLNDPGSHFFPIERFRTGAEFVFGEIRADNYLRGRDQTQFVRGLARHFDAVNHLHPFREGNGRTQRVFFAQLAFDAGYVVDYTRIGPDENVQASRDGERALRALFEPCVSPSTRGHALGRVISAAAGRHTTAGARPTTASSATDTYQAHKELDHPPERPEGHEPDF